MIEIIKLFVPLIGTFLGAYIAYKLAYQNQKKNIKWTEQYNAYLEICTAIHYIDFWYEDTANDDNEAPYVRKVNKDMSKKITKIVY